MAWYCAIAPLEKKIYRIGGGGAPNSVTKYFESFDSENNTWSQMPDLQSKFHASVALNYNNRIYLIGGNVNGVDSDSIFAYYPEIGEWMPQLFSLPEPRTYHRAVVCEDCIYVFGGQNTQSDPIAGSLIRYCFKQTNINDNNSNLNFRVFPNPCQGSFYIDMNINSNINSKIYSNIQVYNILGDQVPCQIDLVSESQFFVKINNPEIGIYYIRISTGNEIKFLQISIN